MAGKVAVLNPLGSPPKVTSKALAPRPGTLNGKTVYLVDVRFDNSGVFMEQLQDWFTEHMPEVKTVLVHWKEPFQHDPELADEIANKGDAAVFGVGL
jgi:hypothetical protein